MGNKISSSTTSNAEDDNEYEKAKYRSFPGSSILEKTFCGSIDTTDPSEYRDVSTVARLLKRAEILCVSSPASSDGRKGFRDDDDDDDPTDDDDATTTTDDRTKGRRTQGESVPPAQPPPKSPAHPKKKSSSGKLLARALVSEVTDNPKTMKQVDMQDRERKLLKSLAAAAKQQNGESSAAAAHARNGGGKPVGVAAPPHVFRSMAFACTGDDAVGDLCSHPEEDAVGSIAMGAEEWSDHHHHTSMDNPHLVTIGVALSRRSEQGHAGTISRQTTYDWNELQDRQYKYVSSTAGWRAGGGEPNGAQPDNVHIPIIHIHCPNESAVDSVIAALAGGEIFIPHITIVPEALLSVHNTLSGQTDLVVNFGCERNDDLPVEDWPNWCLEFIHNQLYDYFSGSAIWLKRPFSITLAKQVRWKTVKHMNRYFAVSEKVVSGWREKGPRSLMPRASHLEGGASADEVARPHGIYLFRRGGAPTNYFAPNFDPPYSTKMTRSLLLTVLQKSWDHKRREWTSKPIPRLVAPATLMAAACGYSVDPSGTGFMAKEVTSFTTTPAATTCVTPSQPHHHQQQQPEQQQQQTKEPLSSVEFGRSNSSEISQKENIKEEKKVAEQILRDDLLQQQQQRSKIIQTPTSTNNLRQSVTSDDTKSSLSLAQSTAYNASVAESGTTVQHTNLSKTLNKTYHNTSPVHHHHESSSSSRRLYSDEDFMDELSADPPGEMLSLSRTTTSRSSSPRQALEHERQRQNELMAKVREISEQDKDRNPTKQAQVKLDLEKVAASNYTMHAMVGSSPKRGNNNNRGSVQHAASLEYSTDGSSAFFTQDATSLYGQHLPSSDEQQQPIVTATSQPKLKPILTGGVSSDDDDRSSFMLSLQESSSSTFSVVPSDDELFLVGWAKALDPNSGNYYYFTLDRTRTVWENPLSSSQWGGGEGKLLTPSLVQPQPVVVRSIDP